jgi:hypothetical protein
MLNYFRPVYDGDVVYSCDMLRLNFKIPFDSDLRSIQTGNLLIFDDLAYQYGFDCDMFGPSFSVSAYRWLLTFTRGDCVIKIGLQQNSYRSDNRTLLCFVEFNPNKVDFDFLGEIYYYCTGLGNKFKSIFNFFTLSRFDLAVDIPVPREFVRMFKSGRRSYTYIIRDGSVTEYAGNRSSHGFVKVYDKTLESGLDYYLTRVEITCCDFSTSLPDIHISCQGQFTLDDSLTGTDLILIEFFNRLDDVEFNSWFRMMPRKKKEKLGSFMRAGKDSFKFSETAILKVHDNIREVMSGDFTDFKQIAEHSKQRAALAKQPFTSVDPAVTGSGMAASVDEPFRKRSDLPFRKDVSGYGGDA